MVTAGIIVFAGVLGYGVWAWRTRVPPPAAEEPPANVSTFASSASPNASAPAPARAGGAAARGLAPISRPPSPPASPAARTDGGSAVTGRERPAGIAASSASASARADDAAEAHTYSAADTDVVPPAVVFPTVERPASPMNSPNGNIEVVVNEHGLVESVKTNAQPQSVSESMAIYNRLSAVKTWRFRPAQKGAQPVRYLLLVPLRIS